MTIEPTAFIAAVGMVALLVMGAITVAVAAVADRAKAFSDIRELIPKLDRGYENGIHTDYLHFAIMELKRIEERE